MAWVECRAPGEHGRLAALDCMLDTLAKIYDDGGPLVGVSYTLFEGNPRFITAVGLRFEALSAVLRAVPDDDTLAVSLGRLAREPGETLIDAADSGPWPACMGLGIRWAWCLTNQQGYSDGVRPEFGEPGGESSAVVEVVVVASTIYFFVAVPSDTA
jgi:hypothetical protein